MQLDAEQFRKLAEAGHTRIPVVREVFSDLDTPLSVYLKLADGPHTYLYESVEGGDRFGRLRRLRIRVAPPRCRFGGCAACRFARFGRGVGAAVRRPS